MDVFATPKCVQKVSGADNKVNEVNLHCITFKLMLSTVTIFVPNYRRRIMK